MEYFKSLRYPGDTNTNGERITPGRIYQNVPSSRPLRRAIYTRPFTEEPETFWFHMFSTDHEDPVAILEADDGDIVVAYAGHVKLID